MLSASGGGSATGSLHKFCLGEKARGRPMLRLVKEQQSLRLARRGTFGASWGLNNAHIASLLRPDYGMGLFLS